MGIWIELGVFVLALAFGLWQIHDVKRAQARTRAQREQERLTLEAEKSVPTPSSGPGGTGSPTSATTGNSDDPAPLSDRR